MPVYIDGYEIDVFTDESHTLDSMVTSDPVEDGADTTDNVKLLPTTITVTGIVSDTPFGQLAERRLPGEFSSAYALGYLESIRDDREPVTIETSLGKYENMVMERLSIPQNAQTGDALQFTATFKQIRITYTQRATINTADPRNKRKVNRGNKSVADADPAQNTTDQAKALYNKTAARWSWDSRL